MSAFASVVQVSLLTSNEVLSFLTAFFWILLTIFPLFICVCLRTDAGNSLWLLEDGLAGEHSSYRHGDQPGGSWQGGYSLDSVRRPPASLVASLLSTSLTFLPPQCTDVLLVRYVVKHWPHVSAAFILFIWLVRSGRNLIDGLHYHIGFQATVSLEWLSNGSL